MKCHDSDATDTQFNLFAKKIAEECRDIVNDKPPIPPCERTNLKPPTLHTFCNHNINIQYKYQNDDKSGKPKPCGICIKLDEKGKKQSPCPLCTKKEMSREEKLAEAIKCISSPLPRWFNEPERCDPMSVCCRMLGGIRKCPRTEDPCSCPELEPQSKVDKFAVNYPPNKLILSSGLQKNPKCKPNFRCQGIVSNDDYHTFKPNYKNLPLTEKFYSKYEHLENIDTPEVRYYQNELEKIENYFPRNEFCVPRYTNQNYGWLENETTRNLEFCDANRVSTPKVLQNLKSFENRRFDPIQLQYCLCHDMIKQMDHWKIV
uniref:Uncharacterized protein n=1 Tax=Bactrocera dorsalis TaxID=27457 RepID=A0A034WW06_BACDO